MNKPLNKPFTLLWMALEFFPAQSQEPTLAGIPGTQTWPGMWPSSCALLYFLQQQDQARRTGASSSNSSNSPLVFREEFLQQNLKRAAGCMVFFWLVGGEVIGQCSGNLVLSLKLLSSTGWGGHIEELRDLYQLDMYNPWWGTRTLPDHWTIVSQLPFLYLCIPPLL